MPHDADGHILREGDVVYIPAKITVINPMEDYCNLSLESVEPMYPGEHKAFFTANARQVLLHPEIK
jgi:hypothetical protein